MNKIILFLLSFQLLANPVKDKISELEGYLIKQQNNQGHWSGSFETDPSMDLLFLVLGKKLNKDISPFISKTLTKLKKWKNIEGLWGYKPQGETHEQINIIIYLCLEKLDRRIPRQLAIWYAQYGSKRKISTLSKFLLAPLELIPSSELPFIPSTFASFPGWFPLNPKNIGILRGLLLPLISWKYFFENKNITIIGPSNLKPYSPGADTHLFSSKKNALKGLSYSLTHQQVNGGFYTFQAGIIIVNLFHTLTKNKVINLQDRVDRFWKNAESLFSKGYIQPSLSNLWDTSRVLSSLGKAMPAQEEWLIKQQSLISSDWAWNAKVAPGGWAFSSENNLHPDTDVTAAALKALYKYKEKDFYKAGLNWLLAHQNQDGGFPAWEKGVSLFFGKVRSFMFPDMPSIEDISQSDITARVLSLLSMISPQKYKKQIQKGCDFIASQMRNDGSWDGNWLVYRLYGTGESLKGMLRSNCRPLSFYKRPLALIKENQNFDGGWGESHDSIKKQKFIRDKSSRVQTAYVLGGLIEYEKSFQKQYNRKSPFKGNIDKAISYLLLKQRDQSLFFGILAKNTWYAEYELNQDYETLLVLKSYEKLKY